MKVIGTIILCFAVILAAIVIAPLLSPNPNPYLAFPPEKIIEQGRSLDQKFADAQKTSALIKKDEIEQTRTALHSIERTAPQYKEAQQLIASINKHEAEGKQLIEAAIAKAIANDVEGRKAYANELENNLLSSGMDAHVSTSGIKGTTLVIRYVLVSRPFLYKLMNETAFLDNIKKAGFTTVHFTNGYDLSGTYDIAKNKWN